MAVPFDPAGLFPPTLDAPDLASLEFPWNTPAAAPDPTTAGAPGTSNVLSRPVEREILLHQYPADAPPKPVERDTMGWVRPADDPGIPFEVELLGGTQSGTSAPKAAAPIAGAPMPPGLAPPPEPKLPEIAPPAPAGGELGAMLPGLGIPGAATDRGIAGEQRYGDAAKKLTESPFDPSTGDVRADVGDDDLHRYVEGLPTEERAVFNAKLEDLKAMRALTQRAALANRDFDEQRANFQARQKALDVAREKSKKLEAEAERLVAQPEDPTGGVSGMRAVAGILQGIIGGLISGRTAAPNTGPEILRQAIDRGIAAQRQTMATRRESLGARRALLDDEIDRAGAEFDTAEAMRLAAYKHADAQLAVEQQKYSPRGTTAMRIANLRASVRAEQAKVMRDYEQKTFDNGLRLQESARQQQIADEARRHNRASEGLQYQQIQSAAEDRKLAREIRSEDKAAERADKEAERDRQFAIGAAPVLQLGPNGKPVIGVDGKPAVVHDDLRNKDGKVWRAASPEEAKELRTKKTATEQLTKLYDRAVALSDRVGGETWVGNSPEYQELKAIEKEILLLKKQGTQGMSSDADMENLVEASGAKDITSFRSKVPGLKAARARTTDKFNTELRNARYTGPELVFPETRPAQNTPEDDRAQRLLQKSGETYEDVIKREIDTRATARGYGITDLSDPSDQALYREAAAAARAQFDSGASVEQRAMIDSLAAQVSAGGPGAGDARKTLEKAAAGNSVRVRELAKAALGGIDAAKAPAPRGPASSAVDVPDALQLGGAP